MLCAGQHVIIPGRVIADMVSVAVEASGTGSTEHARRYPGFAEYAAKTAGIRTIPVLALRRSR